MNKETINKKGGKRLCVWRRQKRDEDKSVEERRWSLSFYRRGGKETPDEKKI